MKIFAPDAPFMRAMSRLADLMILNILFLITSIPIFTIGAATAAMYTVCFRLGTDREDGVFRPYFQAFKENFREGTGVWLVLLLIMGAAFLDAAVCYSLGGFFHWFWLVFAALLCLAVFIFTYAFPLMSQFENTGKQTFKNALLISIGYLPKTILMAALNALPVVLLLTQIHVFFYVGFIWFVLYFSAIAYLNTRILRKIFKPFYESGEEEPAADEKVLEEEKE